MYMTGWGTNTNYTKYLLHSFVYDIVHLKLSFLRFNTVSLNFSHTLLWLRLPAVAKHFISWMENEILVFVFQGHELGMHRFQLCSVQIQTRIPRCSMLTESQFQSNNADELIHSETGGNTNSAKKKRKSDAFDVCISKIMMSPLC